MADQVVSVAIATSKDNPAAITAKMAELMKTKYFPMPRVETKGPFGVTIVAFPGREWIPQGPNFIKEKYTGAVVNLNQEAIAALQAEAPRQDVVAVVKNDAGETSHVWVDQSALQAAGGNLDALKTNLNQVMASPSGGLDAKKVLIAGGVAVGLYWLFTRRGHR